MSDLITPLQGLHDIQLILCDVDGTLTNANGRGHSPRLMPLVQKIMQRGVKIGLVTGRETLAACVVHRIFDLTGPIIGENGAELILAPQEDERSTMTLGGLSPAQIDNIKQRLVANGLLERLFIDHAKKFMLSLYPKEFPHHRPEALPELCQRVVEALRDFNTALEISYSSAAIDISAKHINKGAGVRKLCEEMNLKLSAVAFVGDSSNDRTAFEYVGHGGGWLAFVGHDPAIKRALQNYPRIYFAQRYASEGTAEFLKFFLSQKPCKG